MNNVFDYAIKVNIALAALYISYFAFFRKDTFFVMKRFALLMIFIVSLLYPLINVREWMRENIPAAGINIYNSVLPDIYVYAGGNESTGGIFNLVSWLYLAVSLALAVRLVIQVRGVIRLAASSERISSGKMSIYRTNGRSGVFSFFRLIFLGSNPESGECSDDAIAHEHVHALQWHSADVLTSELMCIIFWINPFSWLLRREIRLNLEYIADSSVLRLGFDAKEYQYHLLRLMTNNHPASSYLYNNFNVLLLKKRIIMINKKPSRSIARFKYLITVPIVAIMAAFSNLPANSIGTNESEFTIASRLHIITSDLQSPDAPQNKVRKVYDEVEVMPVYPGGELALLKYVNDNIRYPINAQEAGVEGRVTAEFIVDEAGNVTDAKIIRSVSDELDAEALRLISGLSKWTPGKQGGKAVAVRYTIPITFSLTKGDVSPPKITVHPDGSISANKGEKVDPPYVIIDGVPSDAATLAKINSEDIKAISVLKDSYVTDKYGENGKNGVIIVTLKEK